MIRKRGSKFNHKLISIGILGIVLISLIGLIALAVADTTPSREDLQNELNNLSANLSNSGYDWLINYSVNYPQVIVYRQGDNQSIAMFDNLTSNFTKHQIFLTNLSDNESLDVFDLKSICDSTIMGSDGNISKGSCQGVDGVPHDVYLMKQRIDEIRRELNNLGGNV
jgi:hypothetical protein